MVSSAETAYAVYTSVTTASSRACSGSVALHSRLPCDDGWLGHRFALPQMASFLGLRGLSPSHPTDFAVRGCLWSASPPRISFRGLAFGSTPGTLYGKANSPAAASAAW